MFISLLRSQFKDRDGNELMISLLDQRPFSEGGMCASERGEIMMADSAQN